jgi:hypothetical protein
MPELALNNVITQSELGPRSRLIKLRGRDVKLAKKAERSQEQDVIVGLVIKIDAVSLKWLYTSDCGVSRSIHYQMYVTQKGILKQKKDLCTSNPYR